MKLNNTIVLRIGILLTVVVVIAVSAFFWWKDSMLAYDIADAAPVVFVVERGDSARDIAGKLAGAKLIRSPTAFYLLIKTLGIERNLQAGDFRLNPGMSAKTIALELTHGMLDVWVTTLEGWRSEEIAIKLARDLDIPEKEFLLVSHEGYMFPDTYLIPKDASAAAIAKLFEENFQHKVASALEADMKKTGLTTAEIITLASIVEREGRTDTDRPVIAGILLNRLKRDWPLQADATLQYALGYQAKDKTWWKKGLTAEDKEVLSSYNTYINTGLPPAPIANPGLAAIKAVVYPAKTNYMYYLHDTSGAVHYAETIEEHEANIVKYLLGD